jgi:opacity protein-like surface antigen
LKSEKTCAILEKMKIKISLAACLWFFYTNGLAMSYKLFTGINTSKYLFSKEITQIEHKQRTALSSGLGISFQFTDRICLEVNGIFYSGGAKTQISYASDMQLSGIYRNTNLAFPIIVKYKFLPITTPYLGIGPEFIYILSHNLEIPGIEKKYNILNETHRLNLGLTLVAGYEYKIKNLTLFGELRYNRWFTSFLKDTTATIKNKSWAFYIGLAVKNHAD